MQKLSASRGLQESRSFLARQNTEGWWSYKEGHEPSVETTAWASIALRNDEATAHSTTERLLSGQNPDGGWSTAPNAGESDWTTAAALLCLRMLTPKALAFSDGALKSRIDRAFTAGIDFLLDSRSQYRTLFDWFRLYQLGSLPLLPGTPCGFPWNPGSFYWTEPTSYALIALKPSEHAARRKIDPDLSRAEDFLLQHACKGGGWNHGNDISLSKRLPAYPVTTCIALIALQAKATGKEVVAALSYLDNIAESLNTVISLSYAIGALTLYGRNTDRLVARLLDHRNDDGSFGGSLLHTALAAFALESHLEVNPLSFGQSARQRPGA